MIGSLLLRVVEGPDQGAIWAVDGPRTVGREGEVALTDPAVSRRHLTVEPNPGGLRITDLRSAGGTTVGGRRLDGPADVRPGDRVVLGSTELLVLRAARFRSPGEGPVLVVDTGGGTSRVA